MSTAVKKARRKSGIKFIHPTKTPTPLTERAWWNALVPGAPGTRHAGQFVPRSAKKRAAMAEKHGLGEMLKVRDALVTEMEEGK